MDGALIDMGMAKQSSMAPMGGFDFQKSVTSMDGMNGGTYHDGFTSVYREGTFGMMNQPSGSGFYGSGFERRESAEGGEVYNGMALPDHFLRQYYSQVRIHLIIYTLCFQ